jgi:hypothetical protein
MLWVRRSGFKAFNAHSSAALETSDLTLTRAKLFGILRNLTIDIIPIQQASRGPTCNRWRAIYSGNCVSQTGYGPVSPHFFKLSDRWQFARKGNDKVGPLIWLFQAFRSRPLDPNAFRPSYANLERYCS